MSQLNKWMFGGKISKLVVVITSKETGEHVERWQFDVCCFPTSEMCGSNNMFYRLTYSASRRRARARGSQPTRRMPPPGMPSELIIEIARLISHSTETRTPKPPRPQSKRPRKKSRKKSKRFSARSQRQSLSSPCWMETAPSTCWSTQTQTPKCQWNGVTVTPRRSRTPRRSSFAASARTTTAWALWSATGWPIEGWS